MVQFQMIQNPRHHGIHQISDGERRYYPDILYPHALRESSLLCLDNPADAPCDVPVDMESSGLFAAATR